MCSAANDPMQAALICLIIVTLHPTYLAEPSLKACYVTGVLRPPHSLLQSAFLVATLAACGDADTPPAPTGIHCELVPRITKRGESSPTSANIDPQPIDQATAASFDFTALDENLSLFPAGIQAGETTSTAFLAWTLTSPGAEVAMRVWRDSDAGPLLVTETLATADASGAVKVDIDGLAADTVYRYGFFTSTAQDAERSLIGRVKTAPPAGAKQILTIATTTCVGTSSPNRLAQLVPFVALSQMAEEPADLLLHVGDIVYNDGALTSESYDNHWRAQLAQPGYQDLLASTSWFMTWDDHEVTDNYNPETIDPVRFAAAQDAFFGHVARRRDEQSRVWTSHQWGDTATIIVTDLRSERKPSTAKTAQAEFISPAQLDFVKQELLSSTAHFKIVFSSVNMTAMASAWLTPLSLDDRWSGYAAQRTELLEFIKANDIKNVWFLAGDIHMGFVGRIDRPGDDSDGAYDNMWELTVGPGASEPNPLGLLLEDGLSIDTIMPTDQFVFGHGRTQVTTKLVLDPGADTIRAIYADALTNEVLFDCELQQ